MFISMNMENTRLPVPVNLDEGTALLARLQNNPYVPDADKRHVSFTPRRKAVFISAISEGASAKKAAELAGVARNTPYYQKKQDPEFADAWADAMERQADGLEDALHDLAIEKSNPAGIIFSLKNRRPEVWRDQHDLRVERNYNLNIQVSEGQAAGIVDRLARRQAAGLSLSPAETEDAS